MMARSRGYVLLTCLFLLAILSVSSLLAVQIASLMAQHARLLDSGVRQSLHVSSRIARVEASLLRGNDLGLANVFEVSAACDSRPDDWIRLVRLHARPIQWLDDEGTNREAELVVYGLRSCENGKANLETSISVLRPAHLSAEASLFTDVELGRRSWREVW